MNSKIEARIDAVKLALSRSRQQPPVTHVHSPNVRTQCVESWPRQVEDCAAQTA